ncbi:cation-transporting P-type ATPase, partial [Limosilactobacillus mucosae]|nr:cation-transporting P-type ATPase [Limosilactobacillus mucosae]
MSSQKQQTVADQQQAAAQKARQVRVDYAATHSAAELLKHFNTSRQGLSDAQVTQSRRQFGANKVQQQKQQSIGKRLI